MVTVSSEPAGIYDDNGEMALVSLKIVNSRPPGKPESTIYVEDLQPPIQARIRGTWVPLNGSLKCNLQPGKDHEHVLLVPSAADSCRFALRYCGGTVSLMGQPIKTKLEWAAELLPSFVRSQLGYKFWRWAGFGPGCVPSSDWYKTNVEMLLPAISTPEDTERRHNERVEPISKSAGLSLFQSAVSDALLVMAHPCRPTASVS